MIFETERIRIRKLLKSDIEDLVDLYSDEEVFEHEFDYPRNLSEVEYTVETILDEYTLLEKSVHRYVVEYKSNHKVIGTISWEFKDPEGLVCEIGGCLRSDFFDKGIGTEVFKVLLEFLFGQNTIRVFCSCSANNARAIRVVEKLGFEKEGHIKMAIFLNGEYIDEVYYGLMKSNYKNPNSVL